MNCTDKLYNLRAEAILELGKIAHKYDIRDKWNECYENDRNEHFRFPV